MIRSCSTWPEIPIRPRARSNKQWAREGKADEHAGRLKEFVEDTKDTVEGAIDKAKNKLTRH